MISPVGDRLRGVAEQAADVSAYVSTVFPSAVAGTLDDKGADAETATAPLGAGPLGLAPIRALSTVAALQ
jgi:hypothetical protein